MGEMRDFASELPYILSRSQLAKSIVISIVTLSSQKGSTLALLQHLNIIASEAWGKQSPADLSLRAKRSNLLA